MSTQRRGLQSRPRLNLRRAGSDEPPARRADSQWHLKCRGYFDPKVKVRRKGCGPAPLAHIAMTVVIRHRHSLTASVLRHVPWSIALQIWQCMQARELISLYLWKTFVEAYAEIKKNAVFANASTGLQEFRFNASLFVQPGTWSNALTHAISPSAANDVFTKNSLSRNISTGISLSSVFHSRAQFLTFLELSHIKLTFRDLMFISEIYNLGGLSLGPNLDCITEPHGDVTISALSYLRSWCVVMAQDALAFHSLRSMVLDNDLEYLTDMADIVSHFPVLSYLVINWLSPGNDEGQFHEKMCSLGWEEQPSNELCGRKTIRGQYLQHGALHTVNNTLFASKCDSLPHLVLQMDGDNQSTLSKPDIAKEKHYRRSNFVEDPHSSFLQHLHQKENALLEKSTDFRAPLKQKRSPSDPQVPTRKLRKTTSKYEDPLRDFL